MQYPVFPWILSDYKSAVLDLTTAKSFRNLEKPIAVQHPESEEHFIDIYKVSWKILGLIKSQRFVFMCF